MKIMAHRLYGTKDMRWMEIQLPELGPDDVLVRVKCCGVCGTDSSIYSGKSSFVAAGMVRYPMTLGHEYSGVVESIGSQVTKFAVGDRVVADTVVSCGICDKCLSGDYGACSKGKAVGTILCHDGGYATHTVMPQRHLFHLPDSVTFEQGAQVEPAATALSAVEAGRIKLSDTVLIIGTGPIGLSAVPFVKLLGASKILLAGRKNTKLSVGKALGADVLINTTSEDLYVKVMEETRGQGVNVVIEASGSLHMLREAIRSVDIGGRISMVAFYDKPLDGLDLDSLIIRQTHLIPSAGSQGTPPKVLRMLESGKLDLSLLISGRYPMERAKDAIESLEDSDEHRIKILLDAN